MNPMTTEQRTELMSDFDIVSSDPTDAKALTIDGTVIDPADGSGSSESASDGTAESGATSDVAVGDQVVDPNTENQPDPKDEEIIETEVEGKKVKVSRGIQKRFSRFTTDIASRDRLIAESNQREAELKRQLDEARTVKVPAAEAVKTPAKETVGTVEPVVEKFVAAPEPKAEDFPTYGEFIVGHAKWARETVEASMEFNSKHSAKQLEAAIGKLKADLETQRVNETATKTAEQVFNDKKTSFETRDAAVKADNSDYVDLITNNKNNVKITPEMKVLIFEDERGPEVRLWLARNPVEAARIAALPAHRQGIEAGIIISKLGAPKSASTQTGPGTDGTGTGNKPPVRKSSVKLATPPLPRGAASGSRGTGGAMNYKKASELSVDDYMDARAAGTIK